MKWQEIGQEFTIFFVCTNHAFYFKGFFTGGASLFLSGRNITLSCTTEINILP
jgi:hypothetical protein